MENDLIVEKLVKARINLVWEALTDNEKLKKWYFQLEEFKPKIGFKFDFVGGSEDGPSYLHLCEIVELDEGKKISYTWRYDNYPGNSVVTWQLIEKGELTLVRIIHSGLDSFSELGPDFAKTSFKGGWTHFGNAIADYLAG